MGLSAFVSTAQSLEAVLLLAPERATDALTNLGSAGGTAELVNGAVLAEPGLVAGAARAELDGTNDYIQLAGYNPFTPGSSRTFCGLASRDSNGTIDCLFGGSGANMPLLRAQAATELLEWYPNNSNPSQWAAAWPGPGVTAFWVMTWNDGAKSSELYIDGASKGVKSNGGVFTAEERVLRIGIRGNTTDPFDGKQLPFAVFNAVLSGAQVAVLTDALAAPENEALSPLSRRNPIFNP